MTKQVTSSASTTDDVPAGPLSPEQWERLQWATQHRALQPVAEPAPEPGPAGPAGAGPAGAGPLADRPVRTTRSQPTGRRRGRATEPAAVPDEVDPPQEASRDRSPSRLAGRTPPPAGPAGPPPLRGRRGVHAAERRPAKPLRTPRVGPSTTIAQVVTMQLTVAMIGLAAPTGGRLLAGTLALAALVTLVCFGLWRGRWAHQWLVHALRWSRRRITTRVGDHSGDLVPGVVPELLIAATKGPADEELGVAYDGTGWCAAATVTRVAADTRSGGGHGGGAGGSDESTPPITLTDLIAALNTGTGPTDAVQVVAHRSGEDPHTLWLVTRVEPEDSPAGGVLTGTRGVPSLLRHRLRGVALGLGGAGLALQPLDPTALAEAASSTVIAIDDPDDPDATPIERPGHLQGPAGAETTLLVQTGSPTKHPLGATLDTFLDTYRGPLTATMTLPGRAAGTTTAPTSALLRLTRRLPADLPAAVKDAQELLNATLTTQPLTYRQAPALAASLPLGRLDL
jgi:hypothetical protein